MQILKINNVFLRYMVGLDFVQSLGWLPLCILFSAAYAWWFYKNLPIELPQNLVFFLRTLRFLAIFLILLLFLEPIVHSVWNYVYPPIVVILNDQSLSIPAHSDSSLVKKELPQKLKESIQQLKDQGLEPHLYQFGSEENLLATPDSIRYIYSQTNISQALETIQERYADQNLGAILMITDGIVTAGVNPLYIQEKISCPIFTAWVGDTTTFKDLLIESVLFNELSFVNTETPFRVTLKSFQIPPRPVQVKLSHQNKIVAQKTVQITSDYQTISLDFSFVHKTPGIQKFQIDIDEVPGENNLKNNHYPFYVQVIENKIKVALFAGGPHPDIGAFYKTLSKDAQFQLSTFVRQNDAAFYQNPTNLSEFNVFVLHNFPSTSADIPIMEKIVTEIEQRNAALWVFMGNQFRLDIFPKLADYIGLQTRNFSYKTTESFLYFDNDYKTHATYHFDDGFFNFINNCPPVLKNESEWRPKAGTNVYGKAKIKNIALDYPLFAIQEYQNRKNVVFVGEGIWRYRMFNFQEYQNFDYFDTWLKNILIWLHTKVDKKLFRVYPEKLLFSADDKIIFKGNVYDETYRPIEDAEINLKITNEQGKDFTYQLSPVSGGYYAELQNFTEGNYRYEAIGLKNRKIIGKEKGYFSVGKSNLEFIHLTSDKRMLEQLAKQSHASHDYFMNLKRLTDDIIKLNLKGISEAQKTVFPLSRHWLLLLIILGLLSTEWIIRKRNGLL